MGRRGRGEAQKWGPGPGPGEGPRYSAAGGGGADAVARSPPRQGHFERGAGPEARADASPTSPSSPHARFSYWHLNPEEKERVEEERRKREEMRSVLEQQIAEKRRQKDAERQVRFAPPPLPSFCATRASTPDGRRVLTLSHAQRREEEERREEERVHRELAELAAEKGSPAAASGQGPWEGPHSDGGAAVGAPASTSPLRDDAPAGFGLRRSRARLRAPSFDNARPEGGGDEPAQRVPQHQGRGVAETASERGRGYATSSGSRGGGGGEGERAPLLQGPAAPQWGEWGGKPGGSPYPPPSFAPRAPFPPWSRHALRGAARGGHGAVAPPAAAGEYGGDGELDALRRELAQGRDALTAQLEAQQQVMGALNAEVQRVRAERAALERQRRAYETVVGEMGRGGGTSALGKAGQRLAANHFHAAGGHAQAHTRAPTGSDDDDDPALDSLNARSEWIEAGARTPVHRHRAVAAGGGPHHGGTAAVVTSPSGAFRVPKGVAAGAGLGSGRAHGLQSRPSRLHGAGPNLSELDEALMDFVERKQGWNSKLHAVAGR